MKFLKDMIVRKKDEEEEHLEDRGLSIEELQRDLDHSGINNSLRDPESAWAEKAALRPTEVDAPDAVADAEDHIGDETVRELDWDQDEEADAAASPRSQAYDARRARRQTRPIADEDFDVGEEEFDEFDEFDDEFDELDPEEEKAIKDNALLVDEIRDAIAAVRHIESKDAINAQVEDESRPQAQKGSWEEDDVFGRKALARDQLSRLAESEDSERILEETVHKMDEDGEANRRRMAMAHLKAAAAATKADSVLKRVVGRDPATDLEHQVQYREDLANVVRQRGPRSETISRPLSRPLSRPVTRPVSEQIKPKSGVDAFDAPEQGDLSNDESAVELSSQSHNPEAEMPSHNPEPTEASMEVEKLDLKTALERQKAILKAEREALEAEIAGEAAPTSDPEEDTADDAFRQAEVELAERNPDAEPEDEGIDDAFGASDGFDDDDEFEDNDEEVSVVDEEPADETAEATEETAENDEWDDGTLDDDEAEAPVDVTDLNAAEAEPKIEAVQQEREIEVDTDDAETVDAVAAAAAPRRAGRVKTRLLGFQAKTPGQDVFDGKVSSGAGPVRYPVGWLVVTKGEGFGHSFSLLSGVSKIGRGDDQAVTLNFGDTSISRDNHAAVAFDEELNQFFLGHGGKSNVVRLNGKPVLSTEELFDGDEIRIGETTLKFIALCSEEFTWTQPSGDDAEHAASA